MHFLADYILENHRRRNGGNARQVSYGKPQFEVSWWPGHLWDWTLVKSFWHKQPNFPANNIEGKNFTKFLRSCVPLALQGGVILLKQ